MESGCVLHVVPHTHWGRAGRLSARRLRLVDLIDHILALLERDPDFRTFTLDGQTLLLEDYLEVRPENRERLGRLIREGRLLVGPWYARSDGCLVSGESTIRSLLIGCQVAETFGGSTGVGYLPDPLGGIGQMPQILRGFGITHAILGGLARDGATRIDFHWNGADGSTLLTSFLAFSYDTVPRLADDPETALAQVRHARDLLAPMAATRHLLLMNGGDHLEAQEDLSCLIAEVNARLQAGGSADRLRHSSLPEFMEALGSDAPADLPAVAGELRSGAGGELPGGALSSRAHQQQEDWRSRMALQQWAEPFSAWAWTAGGSYDRGTLTYAWKLLLRSGASSEPARQIADAMAERALGFLAGKVDTRPVSATGPSAHLIAFNPLAFERRECVAAVVEFPLGPPRRVPLAPEVDLARGGPDVLDVQVVDSAGAIIPVQVLDSSLATRRLLSATEPPRAQSVRRMSLLLPAEALPAAGYATFHVHAAAIRAPSGATLSPEAQVLENAPLRVAIGANGCLSITDKDTGREYPGLLVFEDGGDAGDVHRYAPPRHDQVFTTLSSAPRISLVEDGPVRSTYRIEHTLWLPEDLSARERESVGAEPDAARRGVCRITSRMSLCLDSRRVEIATEVESHGRDHRLRVRFPTGARTGVAHVEQPFEVVARPVAPPAEWVGASPSWPQGSFVDVSDGQRGLAIANRGLPEYEVVPDADRTIALTLLRRVGSGAREGDGACGPRGPGRRLFHFAIIPHSGTWEEAAIWQEAHAFGAPVRCAQTSEHSGDLPGSVSLLALFPARLVLSAVKQAEREDALVVRFYNVTGDPAEGEARLHFPISAAFRANLNEEPLETLPVEAERIVRVPVRGKEIVTLLLRRP